MESVAKRFESRRQALAEKIHIPAGSLGVPRARMPQVRSDIVPDFLQWLRDNGITTRRMRIEADDIKPTQREIDLDKVAAMAATTPERALAKPVIISKDGHLLDGHHRWLALVNRDPDYRLRAVQIGVPIRALLDLAREFPQTTYKRVGEAVAEADEQSAYKKRMHRALSGWKKLFPVGKDEWGSRKGTITFADADEAKAWGRKVGPYIERIKPIGATERFPDLIKSWEDLKLSYDTYIAPNIDRMTGPSSFEYEAQNLAKDFHWYRDKLLDVFSMHIEPSYRPAEAGRREAEAYLFGKKKVGPFVVGMTNYDPKTHEIEEPTRFQIKLYDDLLSSLPKVLGQLKKSGLLREFEGVRLRTVGDDIIDAEAEYSPYPTPTVSYSFTATTRVTFHELGHHLYYLLERGRMPQASKRLKDWNSWADAKDRKFTRADFDRLRLTGDEFLEQDLDAAIDRSGLPPSVRLFIEAIHYGYYYGTHGRAAIRQHYVRTKDMRDALQKAVGLSIHSGMPTAYSYTNPNEALAETFGYFLDGRLKGGSALYTLKQIFPKLRAEADERPPTDRETILAARREVLEARRKRPVKPGIKQSGLPKNLRSKITSINKAIKQTTNLKKLYDATEWDETADRLGISRFTDDEEKLKELERAHFADLRKLVAAFEEWGKALEKVREDFDPENVTFFEFPLGMEYLPGFTETQKEIHRLQQKWRGFFKGYYDKEYYFPKTGKEAEAEGYGLPWMRDRVADAAQMLTDFEQGKPVPTSFDRTGLRSTARGVAFSSLNMMGNAFGYNELDPTAAGLRNFKDLVLRVLELAPKVSAEEWRGVRVGKKGLFDLIYRFQAGTPFTSDESEKIKASVGEATRVLRRFKIKDRFVSGMLVFTRPNDPRLDDAGGRYFYSSDELYVGWFGYGSAAHQIAAAAQIIIHELGHRVWGRLPEKAKKQWRDFFDFLTEPISAALKGDLPWLRGLYKDAVDHGEYRKKRKSYEPPFRTFKWFEDKWPLAGAVIRLEQWRTNEDFLRVVDKIEKKGVARKFITAYGNSTATEAFPEVFVGMLYPVTAHSKYVRPEPLVAEFFKYILGSMREDEEDEEKQRIVEEAERRVRARRKRRSRNPR